MKSEIDYGQICIDVELPVVKQQPRNSKPLVP